jgi:hypothetical protein
MGTSPTPMDVRREHVTRPDVAAGYKVLAAVAIRHTADRDRRDLTPLLGEVLPRLVVGERDRDVHLVSASAETSGGPMYANASSGVALVLLGNTRIKRIAFPLRKVGWV